VQKEERVKRKTLTHANQDIQLSSNNMKLAWLSHLITSCRTFCKKNGIKLQMNILV